MKLYRFHRKNGPGRRSYIFKLRVAQNTAVASDVTELIRNNGLYFSD
jgi:hypothetical protein